MAPHFGFESGHCGASEDEDHPEGRQAEQEDDGRRGRQGRAQAGKGDPPESLPWGRTERTGLFLGADTHALPERSDSAYHHGHVEKDMGEKHRPDRVVNTEYAADEAEPVEQGGKRPADHDGGQHERDGGCCP